MMKTLKLYKPTLDELLFKQNLLKDEATMSYNHAYGGTIDFPCERWSGWYDRWLKNENGERYYRYLYDEEIKEFVGEVSWHKEEDKILVDVLIHARYRNKGYGTKGLNLLIEEARKQGIEELWDHIAIDNPSIHLFLKQGFKEEYRNEEYIAVRRTL